MSEGRKDDKGKLRWQLLRKGCVHALEGVIRVLMYGAGKYGDDNWKSVADAERRYRDALDRHLADIDKGIEIDPDTGEDNWFHVATNALFVAELRAAKREAAKGKVCSVGALWRRHDPYKGSPLENPLAQMPAEAKGLSRVEFKLRGDPGHINNSDPRALYWGECGSGTITHWRPKRG